MVNPAEVLAVLRREEPAFHGIDVGTPGNIQISQEVLGWLADHLPQGGTTLETGSGHSTVVFCSRSDRHIAVAPAATEFAAIRDFCGRHGLPVAALQEEVGISQRVLPSLDLPPLDAVLVDGDHAFPAPFLDYYYVADHVRDGGHLLVDDCHLRTGHVLRAFLRDEPGWEHVTDLGRTAVFRRAGTVPPTSRWWVDQPWCVPRAHVPGESRTVRVGVTRTQLRLRSRLRRWL